MHNHICLTKRSMTCYTCGLPYSQPEFCMNCGMDISPVHICQPRPTIHLCHPLRFAGQCSICRSPLPLPIFCTSCGMDISEPHVCINDQLPFNTFRPSLRNIHRCTSFRFSRCHLCGESLTPPSYCGSCGRDISTPHVCIPKPVLHRCNFIRINQRCRICGEMLPSPMYCSRCGADIAESHVCRNNILGRF